MSSKTPFNYEGLMSSQKYTDLTLSCQGQEFKVHRAIVCTQSPVLAAACDDGFMETTSKIINLDSFDVDTVKQMIRFMYTHNYYDNMQAGANDISVYETDSRSEAELQFQDLGLQTNVHQTTLQIAPEIKWEVVRTTTLKSLLFHVKMNAIADYYDIPELRHEANTKARSILNTSWYPRDFPVIIREVFNSTGDKELHDIISDVMAAHIYELIGLDEDIAPLGVISEFAGSVLRKIAVGNESSKQMLMQRVKNLESKLHETKQLAQRQMSKAKDLENGTERFSQLLKQTTRCRNCSTNFGCYMESYDVLRCSECLCRHHPNVL